MDKNKQLVIVCRNFKINWKQFVNPIYVGVESGVVALLKNHLPIKFICGDFDSITKKEKKYINQKWQQLQFPLIKFTSKKDYIDSELAIIEAISQKLDFQQIVLVTEGKRWDMIFAQLNLLTKYRQYKPILMTNNNYAFSLQPKETYVFSQEQLKYKYVSLFPLSCKEVEYNFNGCKYYPNQDIVINNRDILAISNEFNNNNEEKKITINKGQCLVVLYQENEENN